MERKKEEEKEKKKKKGRGGMKNICFPPPPPSLLIPFLPLGPALMILVIVSPLRQGTARTRDGLTPSQQKCSRRHASRHQPQRRAVVTIGTTIYSRCSKKKSYNKANTVNFSSTTANQFQFNNNRQSISVQQPPINFSSNP